MKNRIRMIIMALLLCMCVFIPAVSLNAAEENTSSSINACKTVEYTDLEEVADYLAGKNTYPTEEGYLFAGWYTTNDNIILEDETKALQYAIRNSVPEEGPVYALFVPASVLNVKAQLSAGLLSGLNGNSKGSIRFVTTVNSLLYKEVGFEVSYINSKGAKKSATSSSNKVYERLYAVGSTTEEYKENDEEYLPTEFCAVSKYFKACNLNNVPASDFTVPFSVKPFWVTLDGSKVYGETVIKSMDDYFLAEDVYVSTSDTVTDKADAEGYGSSKERPYMTLNYALGQIKNQGTIHIVDSYATTADFKWEEHNKTVNITGGTIDFTTLPEVTLKEATDTTDANTANVLDMRDSVSFTNTTLTFTGSDTQHIYANGHTLEIASDVTWSNADAYIRVYGGAHNEALKSDTNLILGAGQYTRVFGAGNFSALTGDVNITLSGSINPNINHADHSNTYTVFGGGQNTSSDVTGDVNITVADDTVLFNRIYGGGHNRKVTGNVSIEFAGKAMGVYGGGLGGTITGDTYLTMTGGWVEQLFGGCEDKSMTGNTNVDVQGGTVKRRVYGGCYNDYKNYGSTFLPDYEWEAIRDEFTPYQVSGYTNVTLSPSVTLLMNYKNEYNISVDNSLYAISRYKETLQDEWGAFILNEDFYEELLNDSVFGYHGDVYSNVFTKDTHHYLITTNGNTADGSLGTVSSQSDYIRIKPRRGYSAVVAVEGTQEFYTESEAVFKLPELTEVSETKSITVTFSKIDSNVDKSGYEARIDGAYYESFVEAVAVAPILDSKDTVTVTLLKDIEMAAQMNIESKIAIQNEPGTDITIYRGAGLDKTDMFNVASTGTLTLAGVEDRDSLVLDGRTQDKTDVESTGSLINNAGKLKIKNVTLQYANKTTGNGAAVISSGSSVEVENSIFENNIAKAYAGAIFVNAGKLSLINTEFAGNNGTDGGAIRANAKSTIVSIEKCIFGVKDNGNISTANGGAIYNYNANMTIVDTEFCYNNTTGSGGAIYNNGGVIVAKNSKFAYNTAKTNGGAIQSGSASGQLTLIANNDDGISSSAVFSNNTSQGTSANNGGGAINISNGTIWIEDYRFENNQASLYGGAVRISGSSRTITGAMFEGNFTTGKNGYGGAVYIYGTNVVEIEDSTFKNNYTNGAGAHGGAIYINDESVAINENVGRVNTFTDNAVNGSGSKGNDIYVNITSSQLIESPETSIGTGKETDENITFTE